MSQKIKTFYYTLGVPLTNQGSQGLGDCPFCGKEQHFFVNLESGMFDCKVCGTQGNCHSFIDQIYKSSAPANGFAEELSEYRGISPETFLKMGLRELPSGEYVVPCYSYSTNKKRVVVSNMLRLDWKEVEDEETKQTYLKPFWKKCPNPAKVTLYNQQTIRKGVKALIICEGEWDAMALTEAMAHVRRRNGQLVNRADPDWEGNLLKEYAIVAVPGAMTFQGKSWASLLEDQEIWLAYDNDKGGYEGLDKVLKQLQELGKPIKGVQVVQWREGDPNDLRDLFLECGSYAEFLREFFARVNKVPFAQAETSAEDDDQKDIEPIECTTFDDLLSHYRQQLHLSENIEDTLAAMLAVVISTQHPGGQLALRVIGPPGSAKSTLAESMSYWKTRVLPRSKVTGLVSGFNRVKKSQQIARKAHMKCLLIKDADTMMQLPNLTEVESQIRDALGDGCIRAEFRTGKTVITEAYFTMIMCGTGALRQMDNSLLGARFLDIAIHDRHDDPRPVVQKALNSQINILYKSLSGEESILIKKGVEELAPPTNGFIEYKCQQSRSLEPVPLPEEFQRRLNCLSQYIGYCRTEVQRERGTDGDLITRPEQEVISRVVEQMARFTIFLAITFLPENARKLKYTKRTLRVLQKLAKNTSYGFKQEILEALASAKGPMSKDQLAARIKLSATQTYRVLRDLREVGIVRCQSSTNIHGVGRPTQYWELTPKFIDIYKGAFK